MDQADDGDLPILHTLEAVNENRLMAFTPCRTMAEIRTVICGDSHGLALVSALLQPSVGAAPSPGPGIAASLGIAGIRRSAVGDAYYDLTVRLARTRHLALVWRGNQHNHDFLLAPTPPLDVVPRSMDAEPVMDGARLLPESAVRAQFLPSLAGLDTTLQRAGTVAGLRRFVFGTPPPLFDEAVIRARMCNEELFRTRAKALGIDLPTARITPAPIRRKLWRVLQDLMAEIAARNGAMFLPAPAGACDARGYLDPAYSLGDATHGNVGYGVLALRQLETQLRAA